MVEKAPTQEPQLHPILDTEMTRREAARKIAKGAAVIGAAAMGLNTTDSTASGAIAHSASKAELALPTNTEMILQAEGVFPKDPKFGIYPALKDIDPASIKKVSVEKLGGAAALAQTSENALDGAGLERDPLVEGIAPSTVGANETFQQERRHDVVFNLLAQTESEVQNRYDTAVLEMFNVMYSNMHLPNNGELYNFLANGNIPTGMDLQEFSQLLKDSPEGAIQIPFMFFPEWATQPYEAQWGSFDPKKGLKLNFVNEEGLFDIVGLDNGGGRSQTYGITPRLREDGGLQIDAYGRFELPPPGYPNAENAPDIAQTWEASNAMQILMTTYGAREVYLGYQHELLYNIPYTINQKIASNMFNKPEGTEVYANLGVRNGTCLLDLQPLGKGK